MLGASMRNPNLDKVMRQRSDVQSRVRSQDSPRYFLSIHPQDQSLPALLCYAFHLLFCN